MCEIADVTFDSDAFLLSIREQLLHLIFSQELNVPDFKNHTKDICYTTLIKPEMVSKIQQYLPALRIVFRGEQVRSIQPYFKDEPHWVLNIIRQSLPIVGYKLKRRAFFLGRTNAQGGSIRPKAYESRYTITSDDKGINKVNKI